MKALILAAGMGTRLLENTKEIPKCLVRVNGKPILEYQLEALMANDIKDIVIVVGYKAEKIREFIDSNEKFRDLNIQFVENKEYAESNSSYSFWLAKDKIKDESYLHFNCDIIFFADLLKEVIESKYDNVIVIDTKIDLDESMEQVLMEGDQIKIMEKENLKNAHGKAVGIAKFSPENINWIINRLNDYISKGDKNQNFYGMIRQAVHHRKFYGIKTRDHKVVEINNIADLKK